MPLTWRLFVLVASALVGFVALTGLASWHNRQDVTALEHKRIEHMVEAAGTILGRFHALETEGRLSRAEAQAEALATLRALRFDNGGNYIFIYNQQAVALLVPTKPEIEGKSLAGKTDANGVALFDRIAEVARSGKAQTIEYVWPRTAGGEPERKVSYVAAFSPWGWAFGTGIYLESADAAFRSMLVRNLSVAGGLILMVSLIAWAIARGILRQLGGEPAYACAVMQRVAQGDLRSEVVVDGPSDSLLGALKAMVGDLRQVVGSIAGSASQVADSSTRISEVAREVADSTERQTDATASIAAAVEEMTVSINHISENAGDTESTSAQTARLAERGREQAVQAAGGMKRIAGKVQDARDRIAHLAERADQISGIANVIKEIAAQTNLLALNAAIEAARAGEQGRGFAVVADEVRGLAERTATATVQIEQMIQGVSDDTSDAVDSMEAVNQEVGSGVTMVEEASESLSEINEGTVASLDRIRDVAEATREQSSASTAIAQRVEQIADMCERTSASMGTTLDAMQSLARLSATLQESTGRFRV
ncbi:MAG: methyl-accepting chemotaxis protein [Rhodocyclaceae bacterium]|nr:methyl-accepting chemotaxis protein [Rhodocyclaceae bacterium]